MELKILVFLSMIQTSQTVAEDQAKQNEVSQRRTHNGLPSNAWFRPGTSHLRAVASEAGAMGKKPARKELGVWLPLPGALTSSLHLCSPGSWGFGNHPTAIYIGSH